MPHRFHLILAAVGKMPISRVAPFQLFAVPYHVILILAGLGSLLLKLVTVALEISSSGKQDKVLQTISVFCFAL